MFGGSIGKGLGGDDDADPQQDAEGDLEGDEAENESGGTREAKKGEEESVDGGVAGSSAHRFPSWVADVDGGGEGASEEGSDEGGKSVDGEGGAGGVMVAGGFGAIEILEGADDVEEGHGKDDRKECRGAFALEKSEEFIESGMRKMEAQWGGGGGRRGGGEAKTLQDPRDEGAEEDGGKAGGNTSREANFSCVGEQDEEHGEEGDGGVGIDFENERHRDKGESDAS